MATRVELPKQMIVDAIEKKLASCKRAQNTATNPLIKELMNKEIAEYTHSLATMSETK